MVIVALTTYHANAQVTPVSQMEKLDRGLVAVPISSKSNFISWRLLGTDEKTATTFDLLRDGTVIASDLKVTNYQDNQGSATAKYQVVTKVNGQTATCKFAIIKCIKNNTIAFISFLFSKNLSIL